MGVRARTTDRASDAGLVPELQELADEYAVDGEIGRGGTAIVYRAWEHALGREVALKIIRGRFAADDEVVARLEREARLVARLAHPNVAGIYSVRRLQHGSLALVMQYVHGHSLRDELRAHGALDPVRARRVLTDVARALSAAHAQGIVHRDVKPENVRIDAETGRALLADFGSAVPIAGDGRLTIPGMTIGTPGYMAPELVDGGDATPASDVYSLGLLGWEMLIGREPWTGTSLFEVLAFRKHGHLPPVAEARPDVPRDLADLVDVAIAHEPEERWRSVDALLVALTANATPAPATIPTPETRRASGVVPPLVPPVAPILAAPAHAAASPAEATSGEVRAVLPADATATPDADAATAEPTQPAHDRPLRGRRRLAAAGVVLLVAAGAAFGAASLRETARTAPIVSGTDAPSGEVIPLIPAPVPAPRPERLADPPVDTAALAAAVPAPDGAPTEPPAAEPAPGAARASGVGTPARGAAAVRGDASPPPAAPRAAAPPEVLFARERAGAAVVPPPVDVPTPVRRAELAAAEEGGDDAGALTARAIGLGGKHSCAVRASGRVVCWGANERGQLGSRADGRQTRAVPLDVGLRFRSLALGLTHSCGIGSEGTPLCWGANDRGQLGSGTRVGSAIPSRVAGVPRVSAMAVGHSHGCAIATDGAAYCWGANDRGQLGTGDTDDRRTGDRVESVTRFTTIAAGWHHSCAVTGDGRVECWGANGDGQLGVDGGDRRTPIAVPSVSRVRSLVAGSAHTCALTADAAVLCWGRNTEGQLGDGSRSSARTPRRVALPGSALAIAAGTQHTCALVRGGEVYCWGQNRYGQLGDGTALAAAKPARVVDLPAVASIDASGAHTCGVTGTRAVYCWGYNLDGQLGDGTRINRLRPVAVLVPVD